MAVTSIPPTTEQFSDADSVFAKHVLRTFWVITHLTPTYDANRIISLLPLLRKPRTRKVN